MTPAQRPLFDPHDLVEVPRARRRDPSTSVEAAAGAKDLARAHAAIVLEALRRFAPASAEDLERRLGGALTALQVTRRIAELTRAGLVAVADEEGTTRSGRRCRRYRLATEATNR